MAGQDAVTSRCSEVRTAHRAVRLWLLTVAALVFAMIAMGGATRLTDSGLSITEWQPIAGTLPPLSEGDWEEAFAKYRETHEYKTINRGMSLEAFKFIFWWEWAHRFLGRLIGAAFLLPFVWFLWRGQIPRGLAPKLAGLFVLGALQGAIGWYMVQSGLAARVDVSQYRLALHLGVAVLILGLLLWVALDLGDEQSQPSAKTRWGLQAGAVGVTGLVFVQIVLGAFVAGLKAGLSHNTWPLMDGSLVPAGLGAMTPWYLNLFENVLTVQFNHRVAGYLLAIAAVLHAGFVHRSKFSPAEVRLSAGVVVIAVLAQIALGIWTLLAHVPLALGLAHQAGAVMVFSVSVWHLHRVMRA